MFDETIALAIKQKLVSHHTTLGGTLAQANASYKNFVPMEVFLKPKEYTQAICSLDAELGRDQDSGNLTVTFRGERRSKSDTCFDDGSRCHARHQRQLFLFQKTVDLFCTELAPVISQE